MVECTGAAFNQTSAAGDLACPNDIVRQRGGVKHDRRGVDYRAQDDRCGRGGISAVISVAETDGIGLVELVGSRCAGIVPIRGGHNVPSAAGSAGPCQNERRRRFKGPQIRSRAVIGRPHIQSFIYQIASPRQMQKVAYGQTAVGLARAGRNGVVQRQKNRLPPRSSHSRSCGR